MTAAAIALLLALSVGVAAETESIRALDAHWSRSLEARDLDAVMAVYADDAVFLVPNQPLIVGKSAIREWFAARFRTPGYAANFEPTHIVVASSADMAYEIGAFRACALREDGTLSHRIGKHLVTWENRAGRWQVTAESISTDAANGSAMPSPAHPAACRAGADAHAAARD